MHSIIVLGADRVGKSTAVKNSREYLEKSDASVTVLHFSGVAPHHHSPVQQFTDTLMGLKDRTDFLILDRFVSDTLFYEPYRYQLPPVPDYVALEPESMLRSISEKVSMIIIQHEWYLDLQERHKQEIKEQFPGCSSYWVSQQLEKRRIEHEQYYNHIRRYVNDVTLIPKSNTHYLPGHLCNRTISLDMAEGFEFW